MGCSNENSYGLAFLLSNPSFYVKSLLESEDVRKREILVRMSGSENGED
jgi:hypothetical protein